ncbi:alpha/beta hydrolase [Candidatus Woesearchaeota archaeon]|nr:alpha/beta hydrolase [Candidatus Woesearchaeota archaeon]
MDHQDGSLETRTVESLLPVFSGDQRLRAEVRMREETPLTEPLIPIILVTGLGGTYTHTNRMISDDIHAADTDSRVATILYDKRYHGETFKRNPSGHKHMIEFNDWANDLLEVRNAVAELPYVDMSRLRIMAQSGGCVETLYAATGYRIATGGPIAEKMLLMSPMVNPIRYFHRHESRSVGEKRRIRAKKHSFSWMHFIAKNYELGAQPWRWIGHQIAKHRDDIAILDDRMYHLGEPDLPLASYARLKQVDLTRTARENGRYLDGIDTFVLYGEFDTVSTPLQTEEFVAELRENKSGRTMSRMLPYGHHLRHLDDTGISRPFPTEVRTAITEHLLR